MIPGFGDMSKMMKQVQKVQAELARLQEELATRTVEASAGGGVVKVVVTGQQEVREITIEPEVVDPDDVEMLQALVLAAVNEGLRKAREMVGQEMARVTGGLGLPPGLL